MKVGIKRISAVIGAAGIMCLGMPAVADTLSKEVKHEADTNYKLTVQQADADYKAAKAKCSDLKGNDKDVCLKDAKAAHETEKADAKANRETNEAYADAGDDKRNVAYKAAKERCNSLKSDEKDACVEQAKATYAK
jgi:hypothetical protein